MNPLHNRVTVNITPWVSDVVDAILGSSTPTDYYVTIPDTGLYLDVCGHDEESGIKTRTTITLRDLNDHLAEDNTRWVHLSNMLGKGGSLTAFNRLKVDVELL